MRYLNLIAVFLSVFFTAAAFGQGEGKAPTLEECRLMARNNYPLIRQYDLVAATEQYSLSAAGKAWIPQVTLGAQATLQNKVPGFPEQFSAMLAQTGVEMPGLKKDQYKVSVDVTQVVWDGGRIKAEKEVASADARQQKMSLDADLYAVESRVDELYFGILLLDNNIEQAEASRELLGSNLDKISSLVKNGAAMQSDADAVEAELLSVGQTIDQMKASRESFGRMLELFIGRPLGPGPLTKPEMAEVNIAENRRPELFGIDAGIKMIDAQERLLTSSTMPSVGLFAQGFYGYPGLDYFASMMNSDWSLNGIVGVKLTWNLSSLYTKGDSMRKLEAARSRLLVNKDVFLFNSRLQTDEQSSEVSRLQRMVNDDGRIAGLRKNIRMSAESKLRNGIIDPSDLLKSITDEKNAMTALNGHEIELLKTVYELKHTVNQ